MCRDCRPDGRFEEEDMKVATERGQVDVVNKAPHYTFAGPVYEPINVIEAWELNFRLANAVKYIARHKMKNGLEDLKKARWYLDREIAKLEQQPAESILDGALRARG